MYIIRSNIKEQFLPLIAQYIKNYEWDHKNEYVKHWHNHLFRKGKYYLEGPYVYFSDFECDDITLKANQFVIKGSSSDANDLTAFYELLLKNISDSTSCHIDNLALF